MKLGNKFLTQPASTSIYLIIAWSEIPIQIYLGKLELYCFKCKKDTKVRGYPNTIIRSKDTQTQ